MCVCVEMGLVRVHSNYIITLIIRNLNNYFAHKNWSTIIRMNSYDTCSRCCSTWCGRGVGGSAYCECCSCELDTSTSCSSYTRALLEKGD